MFRPNLQRIVEHVEGGLASILMGFDGIAVESYTRDAAQLDVNSVGMEFSFVLGQVRKAAEALEVGGVQDVTIRTDKLAIVIRVLSRDYFLALVLDETGNLGKGRYLVRSVAPALQAEL